jgi:DNA-binding MarR family transcriptional regulator
MPVKFGFDNAFLRAWLLLHQTYDSVVKCEDKVFSKHGITTEQHSVLMAIKYIDDPVTPTEVGQWLDRNTNSISLIVERMVKAGLVRRVRDLRDRRSVRLVITSHGKEILDQATVAGWELVMEMLSRLPEEEIRTLIRHLETVREGATEYLNHGESMEEIKRNEGKNMASFMKRVSKYSSMSSPGMNKSVQEEQEAPINGTGKTRKRRRKA